MKKISLILPLIVLLASTASAKKVVCYLDAEVSPNTVDPKVCTNIIYSFLGLDQGGKLNYLQRSEQDVIGYINKLTGFKSQNPNLKIHFAIGGWNEGLVSSWSHVAGNAGLRSTFASNILNFLRNHNLDGIDIDWEFPNINGKTPQDKDAYIALLKTIKQTIGSRYMLSVAIGSGSWRTGLSYEVSNIFQTVDFVNVMTYDLHGSWEHVTGINAPLYKSSHDNTASNVDASIKYLLSQGAVKEKIIMGIPTYGLAWRLSNPNQHGVGAPANANGDWKYIDICRKVKSNSLTYVWDDDQKVPYAFHGTDWVGYDDVKSVTIKSQYINDNGLGGAMIWDIDSDDHDNACGEGKYPLISAIHKTVIGNAPNTNVHARRSQFSMQMELSMRTEESDSNEKITSKSGKILAQLLGLFYKSKEEDSTPKLLSWF